MYCLIYLRIYYLCLKAVELIVRKLQSKQLIAYYMQFALIPIYSRILVVYSIILTSQNKLINVQLLYETVVVTGTGSGLHVYIIPVLYVLIYIYNTLITKNI